MKKCCNCYFYKNVNIGGIFYPWCYNSFENGLLIGLTKARECQYFCLIADILNIVLQYLTRNQKLQRNNKIKQKCKIFRYSYNIENQVASIVSRFGHWILVLSDNKEHLFHLNMSISTINVKDYYDMFKIDKPDFHLHKVYENKPMAIQQVFNDIENHDIYVLNNRYHASIRFKENKGL